MSTFVKRESVFDVVTVGHLSIDLILSPRIKKPRSTLGGSSSYSSLAAGKLGAKASVISKVGGDFPKRYFAWLDVNDVDLSGIKMVEDASSTKFILIYENGKRRLRLKSCSPPIYPKDVPNTLKAKAIHVAPIANELSRNVIDKLRTSTDILSLDPQGFMRKFEKNGKVRLKRWEDPLIFEHIDIYKSTQREIKMVTGLGDLERSMEKIHDYGVGKVIVTRGEKGSVLFSEGRFYNIPAHRPKILVDPTGAGDAFIGAFLAEYILGKNPVWCGCVGSAAASFTVEGVGPVMLGEKKETYMRAAELWKRVCI